MANDRKNALQTFPVLTFLVQEAGVVRSQMTKLTAGGLGFDSNRRSTDRLSDLSGKAGPGWWEGIKRPESDAEHQPPFPPHAFMAWCSGVIKH